MIDYLGDTVMEVISMHQAKSTLSQLVKRAATGETILLGAYGKVEAKLVPVAESATPTKKIGARRPEV